MLNNLIFNSEDRKALHEYLDILASINSSGFSDHEVIIQLKSKILSDIGLLMEKKKSILNEANTASDNHDILNTQPQQADLQIPTTEINVVRYRRLNNKQQL